MPESPRTPPLHNLSRENQVAELILLGITGQGVHLDKRTLQAIDACFEELYRDWQLEGTLDQAVLDALLYIHNRLQPLLDR